MEALNLVSIIYNIIIPLIAAIIGGLFTYLGVRISIKNEEYWRTQEKYIIIEKLIKI